MVALPQESTADDLRRVPGVLRGLPSERYGEIGGHQAMSVSKPRKTYFIAIDRNAHWATQDDDIAAKTARDVASQQGGCQMVCLNEFGGGHITVYNANGTIKEVRPLVRVDDI